MRLALVPSLTLVALAARSTSAGAQITPGSTFTFTGTADATDIGLGGVVLAFHNPVVAAASGNTGSFAALDARGGPARTGTIVDVRVGHGLQLLPNFLHVGSYTFSLLGLPSGRYGQAACYDTTFAVGQTCTPYQSVQGQPQINAGLSPFSVRNVSQNLDGSFNSTAAFDLFGTVSGPGGGTSTFVGTIASSFVGLPYQVVLNTLETYGLQGLPFTGTFTAGPSLGGPDGDSQGDSQGEYQGEYRSTSVGGTAADLLVAPSVDGPTVTPEPTTVGLLAAGLLALGLVGAGGGTGGPWRRRLTRTR